MIKSLNTSYKLIDYLIFVIILESYIIFGYDMILLNTVMQSSTSAPGVFSEFRFVRWYI